MTQPLTEGPALYQKYKENKTKPTGKPPAPMSKIDLVIDTSIKLKLMSKRGNTGQFYLATQYGEKLPCQRSVSIDAPFKGVTVITVEFVVNNRELWIDDEQTQ